MSKILFEYPLNSRIRSYLKLEYYYKILEKSIVENYREAILINLYNISEICCRMDYRAEIIKDIDKYLIKMKKWEKNKKIDLEKTSETRKILMENKKNLMLKKNNSNPFARDFFLKSINPRINIIGGKCPFDLPQLHRWINTINEETNEQIQIWRNIFKPTFLGMSEILKIIRKSGSFENKIADYGFFNHNQKQSIAIAKVKIDSEYYPSLSGHNNKFAINIFDYKKQKNCEKKISFELCCCQDI